MKITKKQVTRFSKILDGKQMFVLGLWTVLLGMSLVVFVNGPNWEQQVLGLQEGRFTDSISKVLNSLEDDHQNSLAAQVVMGFSSDDLKFDKNKYFQPEQVAYEELEQLETALTIQPTAVELLERKVVLLRFLHRNEEAEQINWMIQDIDPNRNRLD